MHSIIQIHKLMEPLLPGRCVAVTHPKTITCDAAFGNGPLAKFAIENDFALVTNVKHQSAVLPKDFINAVNVDKMDYLVLKTTNTFTSNLTRAQIEKPIFLTISNVYTKSALIHTFPSSTSHEYVVYAKQGRPDQQDHQEWTTSAVPSAVAYYLNTWSANDRHNFLRSHNGIESLWTTHVFKARIFLLLLSYAFANTYCIWSCLVKRTNNTPVRRTFLDRLRAGLCYIKQE